MVSLSAVSDTPHTSLPPSPFPQGLQPLLYSDTDARTSGMGWRRVGWDVSYHRSSESYPPHMSPDQTYYTLSWRMQFPHPQDVCYLAHCFPYPLSALHRLLREVEGDAERGRCVKSEVGRGMWGRGGRGKEDNLLLSLSRTSVRLWQGMCAQF